MEKILTAIPYIIFVGMFVFAFGWYLQIIQERDMILAQYGDCAIKFSNDRQLPYNQETWKAAWSQCGDIQ